MDLSIICAEEAEESFDVGIERAIIKEFKVNHDPKVVLCRVLTGRLLGQQAEALEDMFGEIIKKYDSEDLSITVRFEKLDFDTIFKHKLCPNDVTKFLIEGDIHLITTVMYQNTLGRGSAGNLWTTASVKELIHRTRYHLGFPCGGHVECPLLMADHATLYSKLSPLGRCPPFLLVSIKYRDVGGDDLRRIQE